MLMMYVALVSIKLIFDLSSQENVLVTSSGIALLCDFGSSRIKCRLSPVISRVRVANAHFIAPETIFSFTLDERSDVYSLAITIYTLGAPPKPFNQVSSYFPVVTTVGQGKRLSRCETLGGLTSSETDKLWSLITRMWHQDPQCRPTATLARDIFVQAGLGPSPSAIQHAIRFPRHLYVNHPEYFTSLSPTSVASVELALDDVRLFRSNILLLPRAETGRVITGVQEVCPVCCQDMSSTFELFLSCHSIQCLDSCFTDGEARSEKLKLLQDICSLSGQFPETYWLTDVTKGNLISRGGEATVYKGGQNDRTVVVRQLHTISLGEEEEPANKQLMKVSKDYPSILS